MTDEQFKKWLAETSTNGMEVGDVIVTLKPLDAAQNGWQACAALAQKRIDELEVEQGRLHGWFRAINVVACGDKHPRWSSDDATYRTRGVIADYCDAALNTKGIATLSAGQQPVAAQPAGWRRVAYKWNDLNEHGVVVIRCDFDAPPYVPTGELIGLYESVAPVPPSQT